MGSVPLEFSLLGNDRNKIDAYRSSTYSVTELHNNRCSLGGSATIGKWNSTC